MKLPSWIKKDFTPRTHYAKYVPLIKVAEHLAQGWKLRDDLSITHHGAYSVIMIKERIDEDSEENSD